MTNDISDELRVRYIRGDVDALHEVMAIILERDKTLLERLAIDD